MEVIQRDMENDDLNKDRNGLIDTARIIKKKRFMNEIEEVGKQQIDEMQLGFIGNNDLSFDEIRLIKKFCDYMKGN